jgi:hypothetical protein
MTADSDLDLFLVRADDAPRAEWDEQVGALVADVTRWTGNDTRPVEYSAADLPGARAEPVLREVLADALTVAGSHAWLNRQLRTKAS